MSSGFCWADAIYEDESDYGKRFDTCTVYPVCHMGTSSVGPASANDGEAFLINNNVCM